MVDMKTPGIDIRPLRELTGMAMFNEVFFDDVFVPDDCLVGQEHDGWRAARTTLANERVYMGSGNTIGGGVVGVLKAIEARAASPTTASRSPRPAISWRPATRSPALGFRLTLAALAGADPSGSEAAVRKLLGVQHDQHVQEVGSDLAGDRGHGHGRRGRGVVVVVPVQPLPHDRRRHQRHPAQRDRRTAPRPAPRPRTRQLKMRLRPSALQRPCDDLQHPGLRICAWLD